MFHFSQFFDHLLSFFQDLLPFSRVVNVRNAFCQFLQVISILHHPTQLFYVRKPWGRFLCNIFKIQCFFKIFLFGFIDRFQFHQSLSMLNLNQTDEFTILLIDKVFILFLLTIQNMHIVLCMNFTIKLFFNQFQLFIDTQAFLNIICHFI